MILLMNLINYFINIQIYYFIDDLILYFIKILGCVYSEHLSCLIAHLVASHRIDFRKISNFFFPAFGPILSNFVELSANKNSVSSEDSMRCDEMTDTTRHEKRSL